MLFCQLERAQSLREICGGLARGEGRLGASGDHRAGADHVGVRQCASPVGPSPACLRAVAGTLSGRSGRHRFRNPLLTTGATVIDLCGEVFPRAAVRPTTIAVKLHCTLDHAGYLPTAEVITDGQTNHVRVAQPSVDGRLLTGPSW